MHDRPSHVRATRPPSDTAAPSTPHDFACAYEVAVPPGDTRSAEAWARDIWEGAPTPLRWFMMAGWRWVLRLRLGPLFSPEHILGWRIVERGGEEIVCQLGSGFLDARNVFQYSHDAFVWSTFVSYERPIARIIWPPASVLHRLLVRLSLRRAARS